MTRTLRDSEEMLSRMERLVRRLAPPYNSAATAGPSVVDEARAIVAELNRQSYMQYEEEARLVWNDDTSLQLVCYGAKCIAKGRELERLEYVVHGSTANSKGSFPVYKRKDEASKVEPMVTHPNGGGINRTYASDGRCHD